MVKGSTEHDALMSVQWFNKDDPALESLRKWACLDEPIADGDIIQGCLIRIRPELDNVVLLDDYR